MSEGDAEKSLRIPDSLPHLEAVIKSLNDVVHTSFARRRGESAESAIQAFISAWLQAGLGVGPKVHIIHYHLLHYLNDLEDDDGLALWSEQASESSHSAFSGVVTRFHGDGALKRALIEYNHTRM